MSFARLAEFKKLPINPDNYYFMFSVLSLNQTSLEDYQKYYQPSVTAVTYERGKEGREGLLSRVSIPVEAKACSAYFKESSEVMNGTNLDLDALLCVNPKPKLKLDESYVHNYKDHPETRTFIQVDFDRCLNTTENQNHCHSKELIERDLDGGSLSVLSFDYYTDPSDYSRPLVKSISSFLSPINLSFTVHLRLSLREIEYQTDRSLLMADQVVEYGYSVEEPRLEYLKAHKRRIASMSIQGERTGILVKRSYPRLLDVFAKIGGLLKFFLVLTELIARYCSNTEYMMYLLGKNHGLTTEGENEIFLDHIRESSILDVVNLNKQESEVSNKSEEPLQPKAESAPGIINMNNNSNSNNNNNNNSSHNQNNKDRVISFISGLNIAKLKQPKKSILKKEMANKKNCLKELRFKEEGQQKKEEDVPVPSLVEKKRALSRSKLNTMLNLNKEGNHKESQEGSSLETVKGYFRYCCLCFNQKIKYDLRIIQRKLNYHLTIENIINNSHFTLESIEECR
eukprot:CAMPEP_0170523712 /NCGR_PEP_ID=MMETSP0209-20121228/9142_1 /TAXON_ID=665100 ORGANISM="Litonotus pictus, Strain P1" /NCGR_SAMPLE_ID=MMETSP0209 /ASSEMBLY_ACC=CAM_ASM_000301 /LENGTH=511 /DNA_ID=CAMNT_0010811969 /DNA_START=157 /DNA_END=1692 /DNA_ORIENTATION=+